MVWSESTDGLYANKITRGMLCAHQLSPMRHTSHWQGGLLWDGCIMIGLYDWVHPGSGVNSSGFICVTDGRGAEQMLGSQLQCQPRYQKLNSSCLLIPLNPDFSSVFSISVNGPAINSTTLTRSQSHLRLSLCCPHSVMYLITKAQHFYHLWPCLISTVTNLTTFYLISFLQSQDPPTYSCCSYQNEFSKMQIWSFLSPPLLKSFTGFISFTG